MWITVHFKESVREEVRKTTHCQYSPGEGSVQGPV